VSREEEYSLSLSLIFRDKKLRKPPICRLEKFEMWDAQTSHLGQVVHFFFWRTTSRQTHQIMLDYTTDNFFQMTGTIYNAFSGCVAISSNPRKTAGKTPHVLPIKIHCSVIWRRHLRCLGLSWKMHGFCSVAKKQAHVPPYFLLKFK
jgi:hypothetical protein